MLDYLVKISKGLTRAEARVRTDALSRIFGALLPFHPNTITGSRFVLAIALLFPIPKEAALAVVILAGLGDFADGIIARAKRETSFVGALADPLADRFFGFAFMIYLLGNKFLAWQFAAFIVALELLRWAYVWLFARRRGDEVKPNIFGRLQAFAYTIGFIVLLLEEKTLGEIIIIAALVCGLAALAAYLLTEPELTSAAVAQKTVLRAKFYSHLLRLLAPKLALSLAGTMAAQAVALIYAGHAPVFILLALWWLVLLELLWLEIKKKVGRALRQALFEVDLDAYARYGRENIWASPKKIWTALNTELS